MTLGFPVVCYSSGQDYLDRGSHEAGCLILDMQMPGCDGLAVLEQLQKLEISQPVIVLTGRASVANVVDAFQSGRIVAYLQKQLLNEVTLLEAIQRGLAQDKEHRARFVRIASLKQRFQKLTSPEIDVLDRLLSGIDHATIARELKISRRTVENRRARIMEKLEVDNLPALMRLAMEIGYLPNR